MKVVKRQCRGWVLLMVAAIFPGEGFTESSEDMKFLELNCGGACHNLTGPGPASLREMWQRAAPDLSYAGNKYKKEWLVSWLQSPRRIRPAGMFYGQHIKPGEDGDTIDKTTLPSSHLILPEAMARSVSDTLMTLKSKSTLLQPGDYKEGNISVGFGEMMFDKFKGCLACHEIEPGYGGLSGPEVYTAANRLQEDFLVSFMRNHQMWEPGSFMPNKHLKEKDVQKFVHYFRALAKDVKDKSEKLEPVALVPSEESAGLSQSAKDNYKTFCWQCHGMRGDGKGINARDLSVAPRDHTDSQEMSSRSDEDLFKAIKLGGQAVNKSVLMPPWGDLLSDEEITEMVKYLRFLCKCGYGTTTQ